LLGGWQAIRLESYGSKAVGLPSIPAFPLRAMSFQL
jgi:hypothetical protein